MGSVSHDKYYLLNVLYTSGSLLVGLHVSSRVLLELTLPSVCQAPLTDFSRRLLNNLFYRQKSKVREVGLFAFICLCFNHVFQYRAEWFFSSSLPVRLQTYRCAFWVTLGAMTGQNRGCGQLGSKSAGLGEPAGLSAESPLTSCRVPASGVTSLSPIVLICLQRIMVGSTELGD